MAVQIIAREEVAPGLGYNMSGAASDAQLIELWLKGRSPNTVRAYRRDVSAFLAYVGVGLQAVTLIDVVAFSDSLECSDSSKCRVLSSVKSLLSYAAKTGYCRFNVGAALRLPKVADKLAERIITQEQVHAMITLEPNQRNRILLRLLYHSGVRVSELCSLQWRHVADNRDSGQITVFGKGGKTRSILLSQNTYADLCSLRTDAGDDAPVFKSRQGENALTAAQVFRIVKAAGKRAGIKGSVSPHWLRHAHASHSLDRGCPVHVVQATLGHSSLSTTSRYVHARPDTSSALYLSE